MAQCFCRDSVRILLKTGVNWDNNMGCGGSRGKKIAPASGNELNALKLDDNIHVLKEELNFKPLKIHTFTNVNLFRNRAQPGPDSQIEAKEFSTEDCIDVELDQVLEENDNRELRSKRKTFPKMSFLLANTSAFCISRPVKNESDLNVTPHLHCSEMSDRLVKCPDNGSAGVNKKKDITDFNRFRKNTEILLCDSRENGYSAKGAGVQSVPRENTESVPNNSDGPSFPMPVVMYDGSEVDLMEKIERDFS
ncbi:hypothetical protein UPYG_G00230850 [Umbra pygmaea]|uniref:Uncharacterized protein n=1 Tax=Umbra pygmaea TaxID=75934 RepID=A0ABD0WDD5_UMBPY